MIRQILLLTAIFILGACSLRTPFERPMVALPDTYTEKTIDAGNSIANLDWWVIFKDPILQDIIRIALSENRDINIAAARIEEVRAILGFTRADQFPRLEGSGRGARFDPSDQQFPADSGTSNDFGLSVDLFYELDFWGRLSSATEAARAELLASEESYRFVTISLISQVASNYFRILDLDARLKTAHRTIKNRTDATTVIQHRLDKGVVSEIDLNQAQIEEAVANITAAATERELRINENALRVLLGSASYSNPRIVDINSIELPVNLPVIYPAELLNRRPDLLASEQIAKAEMARIGIARAEQLPSFSLLGAFGFGSDQSSDLLSKRAVTWNIGGQFLGPLIDFGKAESKVEIADARAKQALFNYEQAVLVAVQDVEDSLVQLRTYKAEHLGRTAQVKAASNAARLSRARYDDGFTSYLEVLDIERSLFSAELEASNTKQQYLNSVVRLYKALGGGWSNTPDSAGPLYIEVK